MALSANKQALTAAFIFGLVLNAASGAAFLFIKASGRSVFRDGPRLVLAVFLISSSLWAQISFVAFLIDNAAFLPCQVAIAFTAGFDLLARVALEEFLLLAVYSGRRRSLPWYFLQASIFLRFVVGCGFVGVQRPQFKPVCTPTTLLMPLGVVALVVDSLLAISLLATASSVGLRNEMKNDSPDASRAKGLFLTIAGLLIWTATSVPLLLGIGSMDLIPRTVVPATGLLFVIGIVAVFQQVLIGSSEAIPGPSRSGTPTSDFDAPRDPPTRDLQSRNLVTANSYYPPNRYEELKTEAMASTTPYPPVSRNGPLPTITPPAPGQTMAGIGGLPVQGKLYPPTRDRQQQQQQRSISNSTPEERNWAVRNLRTKPAKIAISNPILNEFSNQNPLNRIPTVDLATAARNEKERRDVFPHPLTSNLIPSRPAPQVPSAPLAASASVIRKEVQRASSSQLPRKSSGELIPELPSKLLSTGASSSAQLSPGAEELRRRSPRQSPREQSLISPAKTPNTPKTPLLTKTDGMGSTELLDEEQSNASDFGQPPPFPPPRSPLRPTSGPTLADLGIISAPFAAKAESPVPFMVPMPEPLRINRPWDQAADEATDEATDLATQRRMDVRKTILARSNSVKANVRPSRQKPVQPASPHQDYQSSVASAKTFGRRGTIVGLPSNPKAMPGAGPRMKPMPQEQTVMLFKEIEYTNPAVVKSINEEAAAAAQNLSAPAQAAPTLVLDRPRPRTRQPSMDRPIFPAETSPHKSPYHVRSFSGGSAKSKLSILNASAGDPDQLPPLPPLPSSAGDPLRPQPNKTKSMTFDEKMDMFYPSSNVEPEVPPLPSASIISQTFTSPQNQQTQPRVNRNISKFSVDSSVMPNGVRGTWLTRASEAIPQEGFKRQSSPIVPPDNLPSASMRSESNIRDDTTTAWGSVHSPARAINVQKAKEIAVPPVPQLADVKMDLIGAAAEATPPAEEEADESEVVMVLLDPLMEHATEQGERRWANTEVGVKSLTWHRRVGDECPTFTRRENGANPRKLPPPMPLALSKPQRTVYVEAEPSPLESPEHALKAIDLQLKRLEETNDEPASADDQNRMTLLANLEMEMGMQENYWQRIKHNLNRDSLSTIRSSIASSSNRASRTEMVRISIMSQLDQVSDEGTRQQLSIPGSHIQSQTSFGSRSTSSRSSRGKPASTDPYSRNSGSRMSYLAVMPTMAQLGSPTPPDTDESESEDEHEIEAVAQTPFKMAVTATALERALWQRQKSNTEVDDSDGNQLWAPVAQNPGSWKDLPSLPSIMSRSTTKKIWEPLRIESTNLWTASTTQTKPYVVDAGLWKATIAPRPDETKSKEAPARPLTQKPPRRMKRITMLPDIPESPKPLPNKRDTLGIFQFPWGEKSDVPNVQIRPQTFMAIPGTMSSGRLMTPSNAILSPNPLDPQGYSKSFLDEYEKEDDFDGLSEYGEESSGDDEFDESTLWEIASLLQSNKVPSRSSVFPEQEQDDCGVDYAAQTPVLEDFAFDDSSSSTIDTIRVSAEPSIETPRTTTNESFKHDSTVLGEQQYYDPVLTKGDEEKVSPLTSPVQASVTMTRVVSEHDEEETAEASPTASPVQTSPPLMAAAVIIASEEPISDNPGFDGPNVINSAITTPGKMWSPPSVEATQVHGLPQKADWHTSSTDGTIRAKLRKAVPSTVSSANLWSPSFQVKQVMPLHLLWSNPKHELTTFSSFENIPKRMTSGMWEAPALAEEKGSPGLFSLTRKRTDLEPTALEMSAPNTTRKNAFEWKSLPKISSWSMWTRKKENPPQSSPQAATEGPSETSTEAPKAKNWLFSPGARSNSTKKMEIAVVEEIKASPPSRDEHPDLGEGARPSRVTHEMLTRPLATTQDRDAALRAAIRAGQPALVPQSSEADWAAALSDAIVAGSSSTQEAPVNVVQSNVVESMLQQKESRIAVTNIPATCKTTTSLSLWSRGTRVPTSSQEHVSGLWRPVLESAALEGSIDDTPPAQIMKSSRSTRSEKIRSLHSTSFTFSSQALWNPTRAFTQQQRNKDQKDWLREESAFGWY